jgi:hypothetical protein
MAVDYASTFSFRPLRKGNSYPRSIKQTCYSGIPQLPQVADRYNALH